jgi:hypothetical protein
MRLLLGVILGFFLAGGSHTCMTHRRPILPKRRLRPAELAGLVPARAQYME